MSQPSLAAPLSGYRIHLVGIKGTGMAALAEILADRGADISGSDGPERFYTDRILQRLGIPYAESFDPLHVAVDVRLVIHSAAYDRGIPALLERIGTRGTQPAEVQVLDIDEWSLVGIPAEYFVQHGLRIKEQGHPRHALVVGHANGMVGYVPHRQAFERGGYETTFAATSRLAPEAGDMLADGAIELLMQGRAQ